EKYIKKNKLQHISVETGWALLLDRINNISHIQMCYICRQLTDGSTHNMHLVRIVHGVAMFAMNNILSKWILVSKRSRSLAFVYSGMYT
ncbi:hypothetical protein LOK49_LG03G03172, partial [Camellia lanceoleosa]